MTTWAVVDAVSLAVNLVLFSWVAYLIRRLRRAIQFADQTNVLVAEMMRDAGKTLEDAAHADNQPH